MRAQLEPRPGREFFLVEKYKYTPCAIGVRFLSEFLHLSEKVWYFGELCR